MQIGVVVLVFAVYSNKHHILNNVQIGVQVSVIAVYLNKHHILNNEPVLLHIRS